MNRYSLHRSDPLHRGSLTLAHNEKCPVCQMKRLIGSNQETLGIAERLVAGSLAGVTSQSSIYPMEVSDQRTDGTTKQDYTHSVKVT